MQSPSVVSNGTKVQEDETEVLAGSREVALCLPIDLGAAFRFRPSDGTSGNNRITSGFATIRLECAWREQLFYADPWMAEKHHPRLKNTIVPQSPTSSAKAASRIALKLSA